MPLLPRRNRTFGGPPVRFADRKDAGRRLAALLEPLRGTAPIVLALPRGGVPVAAEVADALDAPLDVLVARKLGVPYQPELAMGAIAPDGVRELNEDVVSALGIAPEEIERVAVRESQELARRARCYRAGRPPLEVADRVVVLVDDGIATGATARAAIRWLRSKGPRRLVLAVPVAAAETADALSDVVDDLVVVERPVDLQAIGAWYERFDQVSDDEVQSILEAARGRGGTAGEAAPPGRPGGADTAEPCVEHDVRIPSGEVALCGTLAVPAGARGVVVFAHGSGSSRFSPRNRHVARMLRDAGLATLLMDLLTDEEEQVDDRTGRLRFDLRFLADRLGDALDWLAREPATARLPVGVFGASTGGGAALVAAAERPDDVGAVVSRGGRPDLAGAEALGGVRAPTLLIVGGADVPVIAMNREALRSLRSEKRLEIVPGATHLFEEPGALEQVGRLAVAWFLSHLGRPEAAPNR